MAMKKNYLSIFIFLAVTAGFAQNSEDHSREHNGFYSNISSGFVYHSMEQHLLSYSNFDSRYNEPREREHEISEFTGFSFPTMEFKFGFSTFNLAAFYTVFNFSMATGTMTYREYEENQVYIEDNDGKRKYTHKWEIEHAYKKEEFDAVFFRTYIGFGTAIYPIQNKNSAMNGFFFGGSVGYAFYFAFGDDNALNLGMATQAEIGKDWWVGKNFSIGTSIIYGHVFPTLETTGNDNSENSIGIMFRMTRG